MQLNEYMSIPPNTVRSKISNLWIDVANWLPIWATSIALSIAQLRHIVLFFGADIQLDLQAEQGVLDGYPHWRLVQSRVLGPLLEKGLSLLFGVSLQLSHSIIAVVLLVIIGVVIFHVGQRIRGRQSGWSALLAFHVLFALMMARPWLYIWDYFILLTAALFLLLVVARASWWLFLLLMSIAFFNHDGAVFIGVWMVAKGLIDAWTNRRLDWGMVGGGVIGSVAGILITEYLRRSLLKGEVGWKIVGMEPPLGTQQYYFFVHLHETLNNSLQWIMHPHSNLLFPVPLLAIGWAIAVSVLLVVRRGWKALPLTIYAMSVVTALLLFAVISETRALLELVPFLCVGGMLVAKPTQEVF
jgi:hypothetical protein